MKHPMKKDDWTDFLMLLVLRFLGGAVLGVLGCVWYFNDVLLSALARDDLKTPFILIVGGVFVGGMGAVVTIPRWQTPWYESVIEPIRKKEEKNDAHGIE